jgi:hypothetical protein
VRGGDIIYARVLEKLNSYKVPFEKKRRHSRVVNVKKGGERREREREMVE